MGEGATEERVDGVGRLLNPMSDVYTYGSFPGRGFCTRPDGGVIGKAER